MSIPQEITGIRLFSTEPKTRQEAVAPTKEKGVGQAQEPMTKTFERDFNSMAATDTFPL